MLLAAVYVLLRGWGCLRLTIADCVYESGLSSFHPVVFAVRIHSMSVRKIY